jgi:hypothetical protein
MTTAERLFSPAERAYIGCLRVLTVEETRRLAFVRWMVQTGRLRGDWPMTDGEPRA